MISSIKIYFYRTIGPNFLTLFYPIVIIIVIAFLFLFSINIGYGNVKKQISEYEKSFNEEQILLAKYTALREVNAQILSATDKVLIVLPEKSPTTWVISQLKTSASENSVIFTKFNLDTYEVKESGLNSMTMSVEGSGPEVSSLYTFLNNITEMAPLMVYDEIQIQSALSETASYTFSSKIDFYWAPLPESLPQLTEPIKELGEEDREILGRVLGLREPVFTILEPSEPNIRINPFE